MPNTRAPGQTLLTVPCNDAFFVQMDSGVEIGGFESRSHLVRTAIRKELQELGIEVPREVSAAPRKAKSGARKKAGITGQAFASTKDVSDLATDIVQGLAADLIDEARADQANDGRAGAKRGRARRSSPTA